MHCEQISIFAGTARRVNAGSDVARTAAPSAGADLDARSIAIGASMFRSAGAPGDRTVGRDPIPDAGAQVHERQGTAAVAPRRLLAERNDVHIVVEHDRNAVAIPEPVTDAELVPARPRWWSTGPRVENRHGMRQADCDAATLAGTPAELYRLLLDMRKRPVNC